MPSATHLMPYRADLDGLRAVAVVLVMLYHAELGVPGGYVGVDVFFVISGFLITSLIATEIAAGTFSLVGFWDRRVRRIAPAVLTMMGVVLVAGFFLLPPLAYADLARSTIAQSFLGANVFFWRTAGYFAGPAEEKPLLHTWSLAVEEQFYVIYPLLLAVISPMLLARRKRVLWIIGALASGSLALSLVGVQSHPVPTFYLLPTRAWELLVGSVLAIAGGAMVPSRALWRETLAWVGLSAVIGCSLLYDRATAFPGAAALPVCLGTSAIIVSGTSQPTVAAASRSTSLGRLLSLQPVVFVGLISYSLYLLHWPVLAVAGYWALEPLAVWVRTALLATSVALAIGSWRYVELPVRTRQALPSRRALVGFVSIAYLAVAGSALGVAMADGLPGRVPESARRDEAAVNDRAYLRELTTAEARQGEFVRLGDLARRAPARVLVWGDSHAMAIMPAFDALCREQGVVGLGATHSATPPVVGYTYDSKWALRGGEARAFATAVVDYVGKASVPNVVLAASWSAYVPEGNAATARGVTRSAPFAAALVRTVRALRQNGTRVWILARVPQHRASVPRVLLRHALFGTDWRPYAADTTSYGLQSAPMRALAPRLRAEGAQFLDVSAQLLDIDGSRYRMEGERGPLYCDAHHLSTAGALSVRAALAAAIQPPMARERR